MELRHLRYFVAVAEELNFTRAAERLYMAQPPLSTQIRSLEEELGAQLFIRDKRRVLLTQAGRELLIRARDILSLTLEAKTATSDAARGTTSRIALGYTASSMFTERLPRTIRQFRLAHGTGVKLSLVDATSLEQLHALFENRLDIGVLRRPDTGVPDGVTIEPWYHARLLAAVPSEHPLAERTSLRVADLRDQPLISYPRDSGIGLYWAIIRLCGNAGFKPNIAREVKEPGEMIGLVAADAGVAILPEDFRCMALPGVRYVPLADREAVSTLSIAYRTSDTDKYVKQLLAALRAASRST
ncbi:MAG: LysR substrate-binding domain-containing protein [Pseudomonadota bacterium]